MRRLGSGTTYEPTRVPLLSDFRMVWTSYQVTPFTLFPVSTVAGSVTSYSYSVFY